MASIDCLIFSKDRPAQLDLLLRSIQKHAPGLYRTVGILWAASERTYASGYERCWRENQGWWFEQREREFETDVRQWLELYGPTVSFLVDDDVFYRDAQEPLELPWSFRGGDYDYPFSVDGNVYAKEDVVELLAGLHFRNPTELEAFAHEKRRRLPFTEVAHAEPCLVGVPLNRVSVSSGMPHMDRGPLELNLLYLAGGRLEIPKVEGDLPAHAEMNLVFV